MVKGLRVLRHKRTEAGCFNEFLIAKTPVDVENCDPITTALPTVGLTHTVVYSTVAASQSDAAPAIDSQHQAPISLPQPAPMTTGGRAASVSGVGSRIVQAASASAAVTSVTRACDATELARRAKRRERNRVAAARCRKKRQDQLDGLADVCRQLEASNSDLEQEVAELASAKEQLLLVLRSHEADCSAGIDLPPFDAGVESPESPEPEAGGMELLETDSCFSPPMVACCGSPPPVWRPATVATRPGDLLLPPEPMETGLASLTTPLSALLTPQPVKSEQQRP